MNLVIITYRFDIITSFVCIITEYVMINTHYELDSVRLWDCLNHSGQCDALLILDLNKKT